ncbi:class I SAM-dependent methyltransferase [Streptomyces jumonjinensis]|uniref:Class I SAM-dependent methyltransferase n=1 Tax=Streptomyces jumonjinensis TaxID=1945 RepID=A0A646KCK3_STRJU|nr:class I SAM-dependent methyltransferase [Streptomyces jumonjinensis]MQS99827.1 class I SAM-dependent methyltransferase [Streptomyces jumonjinensis]
MSVTSRYLDAWEGFWSETSGEPGEVFWDAAPELTVGRHLALYEPHVEDYRLLLLDIGCGNGTQTRFLAGRFPRVLGVDLSASAIELAVRREKERSEYGPLGEMGFRQLDAVDRRMVAELHRETGDCNVYMRGVLQQADPGDRQTLADSISVLVGARGRAFVVEPAEAAGRRLAELARSPSGPPPKLRPVLRHGIVPGAVADADLPGYFATAGLRVLAGGELPLTTAEYEPDGSRIELPSQWLVVGRDD